MKYSAALVLSLLAAPALAHNGEHGGLGLAQIAAHMFEPDHILFALGATLIGVLAFKSGRKSAHRDMPGEAHHDSR